MRKSGTLTGALLAAALLGTAAPAVAQSTLRVAITAADVPLTSGNPDNGFEGLRFVGYALYDPLIAWDLTRADAPAVPRPGLALSWKVDDTDRTKWTFVLRRGVKFHDGSEFNADAVVWNVAKLIDDKAPQYDSRQAGQARSFIPSLGGARKIDDYTVELTTKRPNSLFPFEMGYVVYSSPAQFEKVGRDWAKFAAEPSGTGPWKMGRLVPRERLELVRNDGYWDPTRVPKTERMVLVPMPEVNTRVAALRAGQVDWIEAPAPDALASLRGAGFQISSNLYPHMQIFQVSLTEDSPFRDVRVRKAANLALDREGLKTLLGGMMVVPQGHVPPSSPWYGKPTFTPRYDPAEATKLLGELGYSKAKPLAVKFITSLTGTGQILPGTVNEFTQASLNEVGFKVELEVMESNAMRQRWFQGAKHEANKGVHGVYINVGTPDPFLALLRHTDSRLVPPAGINWGYIQDPVFDGLIDKIFTTFDEPARDGLLAQVHEHMLKEAVFLWVGHDVAPRALSPKVKGFVQAQSYFQDLTPIRMD